MSLLVAVTLVLQHPGSARAATYVSQNGWSLYYEPTSGDGTSITLANFKGVRVFSSVPLPHVFVNYASGSCCTDDLGSGSTRKSGPTKTNVTNGFRISTTYCFGTCRPTDPSDSFSYKYVETYTFLASGEWTANLDVYGPGLQSSATYEVFWRVDYDIPSAGSNRFSYYSGGGWFYPSTEAEFYDDGVNASGGYEWRQEAGGRRYLIDPLSVTHSYGDLVVVFHAGESGGTGSKQYPASLYDNNESIFAGADLVQWYHSIRAYARPSGCSAGGVGCTVAFPNSFRAAPAGY